MVGQRCNRQGVKQFEKLIATSKASARKVFDDQRVGKDLTIKKHLDKTLFSFAKMIDPDGGIDEDHL